jgi:PAS domain-containing protein
VALVEKRTAEFHHVLSAQTRLTHTIFDEVLNRPDVVGLVKDAFHLDDAGRAINRARLHALLSPAYERLKKDRVRQLHFHLPDGTSFLRLHHPSEFGDKLFEVRPSVRRANTEKIYVEGFEEGRDFHAFRHVYPLFFAGGHVGSVEIDIPFYLLRGELAELYPSENLFIIKREVVEGKVFTANLANYLPSGISGNFLMAKEDLRQGRVSPLASHLAPDAIQEINRTIQQELTGNLATNQPFAVISNGANGIVVITALPVLDTEEKVAGYILNYQKDQELSELQFSYYWSYGAITLLSFLLLGLHLWSTAKIVGKNLFLQTIIESLPHPFYVVDTKDFSLKIANSLVARDHQWQGRTCYAINHDSAEPCDEQAQTCPLRKVMDTKKEVVLEHIHRNRAGEERLVEVHGCPIFDQRGNVIQMIEYTIDITERKLAEQEREKLIDDLQTALGSIKQLSGFIPICASCKNIRNDEGYWQQVELYLKEHSDAQFSHGICPDCAKKLYPDLDLYKGLGKK